MKSTTAPLCLLLSGALLLSGCTEQTCSLTSECEPGSYCSSTLAAPGVCQADCESNFDCGEGAGTTVRCTDDGRCVPIDTPPPPPPPPPPDLTNGYDDAPGSGAVFIVNHIILSAPGGPTHALAGLAEVMNDQLRQNLLGGASLTLLEIAGAESLQDDASVTVKLYVGLDADDPFFPADNFRTPPGYDGCCEFRIAQESLTSLGQARWRAPARIEGGRLRTHAPFQFDFPLWHTRTGRLENSFANLEQVEVATNVRPEGLSSGVLSAAWPMYSLAAVPNDYCRWQRPGCPAVRGTSLLDLLAGLGISEADVDLDGDELECVVDGDGDGDIDLCCDGSLGGTGCRSRNGTCQPGVDRIPVTDPNEPSSCALDSRLADGFSIIMDFEAVAATITGIEP